MLLAGATLAYPSFGRDFDVWAYGAKGDGKTLDTDAINRAVGAAAAAGGGTVVFPPGKYLSYSIRLKSRVFLHLDPGCVLIAADPPYDLSSGYDLPEPNPGNNQYQDFGHSHWHNSLIWGENLEDIGIVGTGRIFGFGLGREINRRDLLPEERLLPKETQPIVTFPPEIFAKLAEQTKPGPHGYPKLSEEIAAHAGNKSIALKNCRNVTLRDFTVFHGGNYAVLLTGVDNAVIDGVNIDTNRDGIDIDCCRNIRVSNCSINSPYDDALVLKSSWALGAPRVTENIAITNCTLTGYDEGTVLDGTRQRKEPPRLDGGSVGRFKIGTESAGGFSGITVNNCIFEYSRGLTLATVDGAFLEDVIVSNITMRHIGGTPFFFRLGARLRAPEGAKVQPMRRILISNIVASNVAASSGILISGLARQPIEDLTLSNVSIRYTGGGTKEQASRIVPEFETAYPTGAYWGTMPSWGLWARYVRNFNVDRLDLRCDKPDYRPACIIEKSEDISIRGANLPSFGDSESLILKEVSRYRLQAIQGLPDEASEDRVQLRQFERKR